MVMDVLRRRESLILTAIDVIDELGVQGLSIREIAKRQGISNASIFSHFVSKNELILSVLEHFSQYDSAVLQAITSKGHKGTDAILSFMDLFYTYYENYPAITAIVQSYDELRRSPEFSNIIKQILFNRGDSIKEMVEEAQEVKQLRNDIESTCIADIIQGSGRLICLKWRMENYNFPLKERVMNTTAAILDSFGIK